MCGPNTIMESSQELGQDQREELNGFEGRGGTRSEGILVACSSWRRQENGLCARGSQGSTAFMVLTQRDPHRRLTSRQRLYIAKVVHLCGCEF